MLLLAAVVAVGAALALIFQAYNKELTRAREKVSSGARLVNNSAGPIERAAGFRVIAPSRFGYLGTPIPSDSSSASQADAHAALLPDLTVDRAIIVGVSAGARSAVSWQIRHPEHPQTADSGR
jgi:pimeloyl-ACP methyl ester carboxylesterase